MKKITPLLAVLALISFLPLQSQNYTIDQSHSAVLMKVQRFGVVSVIGRFGEIEGQISYNSDDIENTKGSITVTVDSYTANNPGGEESAKGPAFLDGGNHPNLTLVFKSVKKQETGFEITADLTIKGTTNEISFLANIIGPKMDLPTQKKSIALSGVMNIKRLDYGVGPDRNLPDGTEIIGNDVSIMMEFLAIEQ